MKYIKYIIDCIKQIIKILKQKEFWEYVLSLEWLFKQFRN